MPLRALLALFATFAALALPAAHARSVLGARKLECPILRPIAQGFLSNHIEAKSLDGEHEARTIDRFLYLLDPQRRYLLEADVARIRDSLKDIFEKLSDTCAPIERAHEIAMKRYEETAAYVKQALSSPEFKMHDETELVSDPKLRKRPTNAKEAHELLDKFLQFDLTSYLASDMKLPEAKQKLIHRYEVNAKKQAETTPEELYGLFLDAFAQGLDAHSSYLPKDALEDFEIGMRLSLEGIGAALVWEDGYTVVDSLIPGGSAERSGEVMPKDKILAVAQGDKPFEHVVDMQLRDVVKLIRGPKGTMVRLTLLRQGGKGASHLLVTLKRDKVSLEDEAAKIYYTERKIEGRALKLAVIELPSFYGDMNSRRARSCFDDMRKLVGDAAKKKVDGIVLDLSKNGGGLLSEAVRIAGLFLKKGNVVATMNSKGSVEMLADEDDALDFAGPLVVLTSRFSASASEIVAGALQDYHRAVIVGADHTFGKGSVQAMITLGGDLGAIKVTTGKFYVPGGHSTQFRGVPGDVVLPSVYSTKDFGEDALDYPLPKSQIKPFLSESANGDSPAAHWQPVDEDLVHKLRALSSSRVEKDTEFQKIRMELVDLEKKAGVIRVGDSLKKQKEDKADPKKKALTKRGKHQTDEEYLKNPQVAEAVSVLSDMVQLRNPNAQAAAN